MKLLPCPCCRSQASLNHILVGSSIMWQVSCQQCFMSTDYDESKGYLIKKWNMRKESERLKIWVYFLIAMIPFAAIAGGALALFANIIPKNIGL